MTVRGFLTNFSLPTGALSSCQVSGPAFQAEVSTAGMVGVISSGFVVSRPSTTITALESQVVGTAEGDPVTVVTVQTAAGVASVHMAFSGGKTDQMAPVKGWAALAAPGSAATGSAKSAGSARSAGGAEASACSPRSTPPATGREHDRLRRSLLERDRWS